MKVFYDGEACAHPASGREWLPGVNDASEEQALAGARGGLKLRKATDAEVRAFEATQNTEVAAREAAQAKAAEAKEKADEKADEKAERAAHAALGLGVPEPTPEPVRTRPAAAPKRAVGKRG